MRLPQAPRDVLGRWFFALTDQLSYRLSDLRTGTTIGFQPKKRTKKLVIQNHLALSR
jgi:hypothetical protein